MIFQTFRNDAMKRALGTLVLAATIAVLSPSNGFAQGDADTFVTPEIKPLETLGGLRFGGDANQLEGIAGEAVPGRAGLAEPDFSSYGPVGGSPNRSTADQAPTLTPQVGETIQSQTQALPNQYEGQLIMPDWLHGSAAESPASSRRTPVSQTKPEQRPQSNAALTTPRLLIDGMKAIESANREIDSRTHEVVRERYPDGSIKIVRTIAQDSEGNYYNDGGWLMYDRQQRPIASGTFVRGAMEGDWERVHESGSGGLFSQAPFNLFSGPFLSRANFVRNDIDGVWTISDNSGKIICSITYENGTRNGLASWFYPSGKKMREAAFKDGVPDGFVLQWDQQGKQQLREQFVDGRKVIRRKSTFANQTLASERAYQGQKLIPQGTDSWWAAKPATFARDGEELQHGPVAEWYPNRQPKMTGRYVEDLRDGLFTWWHSTHNKKAEGNFLKGQRVGLWRYWHESGMKRSEGEFRDDEPFGVWRIWNEDGKLIDEKTFPLEEPILDDVGDESDAETTMMDRDDSVDSEVDAMADLDNFKIEIEDEPASEEDPIGEKSDEESLEGIQGEAVQESGNPGSLLDG